MKKGNILVIGNSGVGKSTLINAVMGESVAESGWGISGTTKKLKIYENEEIPFRVIDTEGFEPSFIKKHLAINAIKKWSKDSTKEDNEEKLINVIWFCVDGTSSKLFPDTIKNLSSATKIWESVPVIVVITKSYSQLERKQNIEMVNSAFAKQKKYGNNLKQVIPVVAQCYHLNDYSCAPIEGITELIDFTNKLIPEGVQASQKDISKYKLKRKRAFAQSLVFTSTTTGTIIGAIPIPMADAMVLTPLELAEINGIRKIYGINGEGVNSFVDSIMKAGTVGTAAKTTISALKALPGVNVATSVLNAVVAGGFIVALGEASIYIFEQVYLGKKSLKDIEWASKIVESKFNSEFVEKILQCLKKASEKGNIKELGDIINEVFKNSFSKNS